MTLPAIGFHGCSAELAEEVISGRKNLRASTNKYDWLGFGVYFWEDDSLRAREWAEKKHPGHPGIIGARISLNGCLDLTTRQGIATLQEAYAYFATAHKIGEIEGQLPQNKNQNLRYLDCAVIEFACRVFKFRSCRGAFEEGKPAFLGSMIRDHTHIQLCVRDLTVITELFSAPAPTRPA